MASACQRGAVLLLERHERAVGRRCGWRGARRCSSIEREQAADLGLVGHQLHQQAGQANRFGAQVGAHQVVVFSGGIAFVEDQVDDAEHRGQPLGQQLARRHLVGNAGLLDLALGAHQALRRRRLGFEEGARDLARAQAAERAQGEGHLRRLGEGRMAAGEDEAQPIVLDAGVRGAVDRPPPAIFGRGQVGRLVGVERAGGAPAQQVEGAVACDRGQPGRRRRRQAFGRPDLEGLGEGVLHRVFGELEVAEAADQAGQQARPFGAADAIDDRGQHRRGACSPIDPRRSPQSASISTAR